MPFIGLPLLPPSFNFKLDHTGVAAYFGGEEAASAMTTIHLYEGRRLLGWFNSPGSWAIAKRFGHLANVRFDDTLLLASNDSPALSFGLDGKKGPECMEAWSGTTMPTGHLAYLMMRRAKKMKAEEIVGRVTKPCSVAYIAMKPVQCPVLVERLPLRRTFMTLVPITVSVFTCIACALANDWVSFSLILLGIVSMGLTSLVIGNGRLVIKSLEKPAGSCPGHTILMEEDDIVVVKGRNLDVLPITRGRFELEMHPRQKDGKGVDKGRDDGCAHYAIGVCMFLLAAQSLLQLLLLPQGTLFGQIMLLVSFGTSWVYNAHLSPFNKENIQTEVLFRSLGNPEMRRFCAGTRTAMAVFVCLLLFHGVNKSLDDKERALRMKILQRCIPNDTVVWTRWRNKVIDQLLHLDLRTLSLSYLQHEQDEAHTRQNSAGRRLSGEDRELLNVLLDDATEAFKAYFSVCGSLPVDSDQGVVHGW